MNRLYTGDEHFTYDGMPTNRLLSDFLFWVSSDLTNSVTRSILAEYIVSSALDLDVTLRQTNEPYRLTYNGNIIEVKSSAYIQSLNNNVLTSRKSTSSVCLTISTVRRLNLCNSNNGSSTFYQLLYSMNIAANRKL